MAEINKRNNYREILGVPGGPGPGWAVFFQTGYLTGYKGTLFWAFLYTGDTSVYGGLTGLKGKSGAGVSF